MSILPLWVDNLLCVDQIFFVAHYAISGLITQRIHYFRVQLHETCISNWLRSILSEAFIRIVQRILLHSALLKHSAIRIIIFTIPSFLGSSILRYRVYLACASMITELWHLLMHYFISISVRISFRIQARLSPSRFPVFINGILLWRVDFKKQLFQVFLSCIRNNRVLFGFEFIRSKDFNRLLFCIVIFLQVLNHVVTRLIHSRINCVLRIFLPCERNECPV